MRSPDVQTWEDKFVAHCETAIRGSSALRAALRRRSREEMRDLEGGNCLGSFGGLQEFYDSITLFLLSRHASETGYLTRMLVYDAFCHRAPRVLDWISTYSSPIPVTKSISAGSKKSNTVSRIMLYPVLGFLHMSARPGGVSSIELFVDDIA